MLYKFISEAVIIVSAITSILDGRIRMLIRG